MFWALFWALKSHSLRSCDFRAQNRLDPSNAPRNVNSPHKNHKAPRHIINSVINSYKCTVCTNPYPQHFCFAVENNGVPINY